MRVEPIRDRDNILKMERALKYAGWNYWFVFKFGINTALRIGDLLKLRVVDVKQSMYLNLRETKTRKLKRFYVNESLREIVNEYIRWMDDHDFLFRSYVENIPLLRSTVYRVFRTAAESIGVENVGTHTMRKTFGYHFYRETGDIAMLMELLNHSNERDTLIYIGVVQEEADRAVKGFFL